MNVNFIKFFGKIFSFKTWTQKIVQLLFYSDFSGNITKSIQNCKLYRFFWSEYILKTDAVLDHLPASSYTKFVGYHEHPKEVTMVYGLANSFYKKQAFTARGSDSANNTV